MAQFSYKARKRSGELVEGVLDVPDRSAALAQIQRSGLRGGAKAIVAEHPVDCCAKLLHIDALAAIRFRCGHDDLGSSERSHPPGIAFALGGGGDDNGGRAGA